jgi:hypothetical protein
LTGVRILAEIGDDRSRFAHARSLKAYSGAPPVTRASGKSRHAMTRRVKNQRLAAVGYVWAFCALNATPGARAHHDRRRRTSERHTAGRARRARGVSRRGVAARVVAVRLLLVSGELWQVPPGQHRRRGYRPVDERKIQGPGVPSGSSTSNE